jgi:hypothetical protein
MFLVVSVFSIKQRSDLPTLFASGETDAYLFSLVCTARLGSAASVVDFSALGSSFSLRAAGRLGSRVSVFGQTRLGASSSSVLAGVFMGSTVSVR